MKRFKLGKRKSRRSFSRGAMSVHPKNMLKTSGPMRGGIRL